MKRIFFPGLIFFLISFGITLIWFKMGLLYGGAEVGIFGFNPARSLGIQQFIWWDDVAPGVLVPQFISAVPLYFVLSILQKVFSPLVLQALVFFSSLFLMGYGMYLFALYLLGKDKRNYAVLAGLFYMLNSYVLVEIWHRFLYTGIFLAAVVPVLVLFWRKWIKEGKFIFLVIFLLINLTFSYMYGNLTSLITVWIMCFLITVADLVLPWQGGKYFLKTGYKFVAGFLLFLLTNLWWLIPVLKVSTEILPTQHSSEDNISTLVNISKQTILPYTLQFANPFYLFYTTELGIIYRNFIFLIIPWIPTTVIFIGLLFSLKKRYFAGFGFAYLLSVLLSKGVAQPFGHPYIWAFMNSYFVGVLRNPFEKLGILLPFFGSILFVVGLEGLVLYSKRKFGSFISNSLVVTILIGVLIYAFPMFTGRVFNKPDYPLKVKVPETYQAADNWFKIQKKLQGNILHLPFPARDVVTYNWEYGYHGVEINEILFTALPSITRNVGIKRVDDTLKSLSFIFNKPFSEDKDQTLRILQSLNVQYIILHKDTRWEDSATYGKDIRLSNPNQIEDILNNFEFLEKSAMFGDLVIYKLKDDFYQPKIVFSNYDNSIVYPGESDIMQIQKLVKGNQTITQINNFNGSSLQNVSELLMFPDKVLYNLELSKATLENIVNFTLISPNDPNSLVSQLKLIKRTFHDAGVLSSEKLANQIIIATDNLINLNKARISIQNDGIGGSLDNYIAVIDNIFSHQFVGSNIQVQYKSVIARVFRIHLYILRQLYENLSAENKLKAKEIYDKLNNYLVSNYILPANILDENNVSDAIQRKVHHFDVPFESSYELLINGASSLSLYHDALSKLNIQVDGKNFVIKDNNLSLVKDDTIVLGNVELNKGSHEISYSLITSSNIVSNLASNIDKFITLGNVNFVDKQIIKLSANSQGGSLVGSALSGITGGESYEITFEALSENTGLFYLDVPEDTEGVTSLEEIAGQFTGCNKSSCYTMRAGSSQTDWQNYSIITTPLNLATRQALLRIVLPPNNVFNTLSTMQIKNLRVNRIMDNNLILRRKLTQDSTASLSAKLIEMKKINPVRYNGKIKIDRSTFMFFKETFNPGWILKLNNNKNNKETFTIDKHYLGNLYGNTYYIDKIGEYDFSLEFEPQKYVDYGIIFSIGGWIGVLVILVYSEFRRKYES